VGEPILEVGRQAGMCVHDGTAWRKAAGDGAGHQQVDIVSLPDVNAGVRAGQIQQAYYNGVPGDTAYHDLVVISGKARILSLDFVSNHRLSRFLLATDVGLRLGVDAATPEIWTGIVLENLQRSGGESSLFKIGRYDDTALAYSAFLKRELVTDVSLRIQYRAGTSTADVGISVIWVALT